MLFSDTWGWSENIIGAFQATVGITVAPRFISESLLLLRRAALSMQVGKKNKPNPTLIQIFALGLSLLFSSIVSAFLASRLTQTGAR